MNEHDVSPIIKDIIIESNPDSVELVAFCVIITFALFANAIISDIINDWKDN